MLGTFQKLSSHMWLNCSSSQKVLLDSSGVDCAFSMCVCVRERERFEVGWGGDLQKITDMMAEMKISWVKRRGVASREGKIWKDSLVGSNENKLEKHCCSPCYSVLTFPYLPPLFLFLSSPLLFLDALFIFFPHPIFSLFLYGLFILINLLRESHHRFMFLRFAVNEKSEFWHHMKFSNALISIVIYFKVFGEGLSPLGYSLKRGN